MEFEMHEEGVVELTAKMRSAPQIVKAEMIKGIDRLTFFGQATSMKEARVRTGTMRRSITQQKATFAGGEATGSWGTNIPYAKYQEYGTRYITPNYFMKKGRIT